MSALYSWSKLAHIALLVLWIGPPLGAYIMVALAHRSRDKERIIWSERACEVVLVLEHVCFVLLLLSGFAMLYATSWALLEASWMVNKLYGVGAIVAFELVDIAISHVVLSRVFASDDPFEKTRWARQKRARGVLIALAAPIAFAVLPYVFYCATIKP